jgi:hypothetical protein
MKTKETFSEIETRLRSGNPLQLSEQKIERTLMLVREFNDYGNESYLFCPIHPNTKVTTADVFGFLKIDIIH